MRWLFFITTVCVMSSIGLPAQGAISPYAEFDKYQKTISYEKVKGLIDGYVRLDSHFDDYLILTPEKLVVFASPEHKQMLLPEYTLFFGNHQQQDHKINEKVVASTEKPLKGLRIAIDPGHLGGELAQVEERWVAIPATDGSTTYSFDEGSLAAATACCLRTKLVALGAEVMLTKEKPGQAVYEKSFTAWCQEEFGVTCDADWVLPAVQKKMLALLRSGVIPNIEQRDERIAELLKLSAIGAVDRLKQALFRLCYNQKDLMARIEKIRSFAPDLTLVIHYNAHGRNSNTVAVDDNYNMAFIPGGIEGSILSLERARTALVRLLVTPIIVQSHLLASCIGKAMEQELGVSLLNIPYSPTISVERGVYARNLALLRSACSPICYGESLIQNNYDEAVRLAQKDFLVDGMVTSSRVEQVAEAYCKGVCEYVGLLSKK
jgi:N-acetylmuramoyl-L-alanine amidase